MAKTALKGCFQARTSKLTAYRHFSCSFVLLFLRFCNFAIWGLGDLTYKSIILVLVLELAGEPEGDDCLAAVLGIHLEIAAYGVEDGLADGDAEG